ncbi:unnamed protein product [Acanthoscelides obtectus]|uniref:Gag-like protein n=1 Tax=Acanthoscelides obtectus TaxID=200917 RepID=A0A9P0LVG9_ACAOB|nr:unnamed protein product [Acanthoscelides obtectus]CAK1651360.1 hypothetical protein AOBTE_LOCUS17219 [Acanthoscelides obtectus]
MKEERLSALGMLSAEKHFVSGIENFNNKVENIKNGGILIKCDGSDDANKLKDLASRHLSADYEVKEVKKFNPRLKIVGMSQCIEKEELYTMLKSQNNAFHAESECSVLKVWPTKKSATVYQPILDVDCTTYANVLNQGKVLVNYDSCAVYDAINLKLCFKCCGLNHYAKKCRSSSQTCVKCSLDHKVSDCRSVNLKCINCVNAHHSKTDHAAWDTNQCTVYKNKLNEYKKSITGDV